jgi:hypothetical protein
LEQIEQVELRIEELREAIQRSQRLMLAGRACAIIGPTLLVCLLLGLPRFTPSEMVIGIALGIGGLVLMGSSKASTEELELLLKQSEEERNCHRRPGSRALGITVTLYLTTKHNSLCQRSVREHMGVE